MLPLDRISNHQDWLKTQEVNYHKYRSRIYTGYETTLNTSYPVTHKYSTNDTGDRIIIPVIRNDIDCIGYKIEHCSYCFVYNPNSRNVDLEISIKGKNTYIKVASVRIKDNQIKVTYQQPNLMQVWRSHYLNIKTIKSQLLDFLDDIESRVCKDLTDFMSKRQLRKKAYSKRRVKPSK